MRLLRALGRIVLQLLIAVVLGALPILLVAEPLTALRRRGYFLTHLNEATYDRIINMIAGPLFATAIVASVIIAARWIDRRPLAAYGVIVDRRWWTHLAFGLNATGVSLALALSFSIVKARRWRRADSQPPSAPTSDGSLRGHHPRISGQWRSLIGVAVFLLSAERSGVADRTAASAPLAPLR